MVNVDFMLACVANDGPTINQYWVSVAYWLRLHTVRTMTQRWVHGNPQSEMLSQH